MGLSIETLLDTRATRCLDFGGKLEEAQHMLPTWQRLWNDFAAYVEVRDLINRAQTPGGFSIREVHDFDLVDHLVAARLLELRQDRYGVANARASQRLRGSWLEELGAIAAVAAGCEEVRFSQRLVWRSRYSEDVYQNEIDVLARCVDRLIFISCKALAPMTCHQAKGADHIFDALKEVAYWRQHFNAGHGQAILLTTADLVDEQRRRYRHAGLMDHADILGVHIVSADAGNFDGLVRSLKEVIASG